MSLLLGTRNIADQDVAVGGIVNLGNVYRRYCKKVNGVKAFDFNGNSITLNQSGIYHVTATLVASAGAAGNVTYQLLENGVAVLGALSTEAITVPDTQLRTFVIDAFIIVDDTCVLGNRSTLAKTISIEGLETASTVANVVVNVVKEV